MNKYDLSVLIPARNEMFISNTVENVLKNIRGKTEVIVVLDGKWAEPAIVDDPRLTIMYVPEAIGQRAATNQAARLSRAKYVMKLDAHCAMDEGFDVKMIDEMQDDITMIPMMYNLHAFDWVCYTCGNRIYQSPTPGECTVCKKDRMAREIIWKPRLSKKSLYYRFDKTLHFQYWGAYGERKEAQGDVVEILSAQGSCFMLTREKFWELKISDEELAGKSGWGQQGVEVAMKTWLSGGRLMVNKKTWYAHMFRTQGGDFGFPFPISGREVEKTREISRNLWINNTWDKALPGRDFNWLLEKFAPVPDWHVPEDKKKSELKSDIVDVAQKMDTKLLREIIFYTDNQLKLKYAHAVQKQLQKIGLPITSVSLKPMPHFGKNIHIPLERGLLAYFAQITAALQNSKADIVYMCEHDVIYHPSHFDFIPERKDKFYFNVNFWRIRPEVDNLAVHWDANQVSGLVCDRLLLLDWYKKKFEDIVKKGFDRSYEPGNRDPKLLEVWRSKYPNVDIRHGGNLTKSKWSLADFRDKSTSKGWEESIVEKIPGWDKDSDFLHF